MELWKDIPNYEGLYQASTEGRIRTHKDKVTYTERHGARHWKERIMKQKWQSRNNCSNPNKDARVELWKDGKHSTQLVARLVALTWVNGYAEGMTVNHIDGDSTNNNASNLEWVTRKDNISKGFEIGAYRKSSMPCVLEDNDGNASTFRSMAEASAYLGRNHGYISGRIGKKLTDVNGNEYTVRLT